MISLLDGIQRSRISVWNTHSRIDKAVAEAHIHELSRFSPAITIPTPLISSDISQAKEGPLDLDTPDELAIRSLIIGMAHRVIGEFNVARAFLNDAHSRQSELKTSTWVGGIACFELAVLELKELDALEKKDQLGGEAGKRWDTALKSASSKLEQAMSLSGSQVDLSSRLDSRVAMLRDEIGLKKEMLAAPAN